MVESDDEIFSPATLRLGEIHWYVLRASHLMHDKTIIEIKVGEGKLSRQEYTDFGKEVGRVPQTSILRLGFSFSLRSPATPSIQSRYLLLDK